MDIVRFRFDGRELTAPAGATVAAALIGNGIRSWRRTRFEGRPRGLFCGIGSCYDCLIDIGDARAVLACLTPVHDGDDVRTSG